MTNITNLEITTACKCGNILGATIMRVFTTIYLAETLRANIECVEKTEGLDQLSPGVVEFTHTLREQISMLENRGIYETEDLED